MATLAHSVGSQHNKTLLSLIERVTPADLDDLKTWLETPANTLPFDSSITFLPADVDAGYTLLALILITNNQASSAGSTAASNVLNAAAKLAASFSELKESQALKDAAASLEENKLATLASYCPDLDPTAV